MTKFPEPTARDLIQVHQRVWTDPQGVKHVSEPSFVVVGDPNTFDDVDLTDDPDREAHVDLILTVIRARERFLLGHYA